jgi:hypothetical protein
MQGCSAKMREPHTLDHLPFPDFHAAKLYNCNCCDPAADLGRKVSRLMGAKLTGAGIAAILLNAGVFASAGTVRPTLGFLIG